MDCDTRLNHMLFPGWPISDMVPILWAETSSIGVKGYISLDYGDAILQKHLSTQ